MILTACGRRVGDTQRHLGGVHGVGLGVLETHREGRASGSHGGRVPTVRHGSVLEPGNRALISDPGGVGGVDRRSNGNYRGDATSNPTDERAREYRGARRSHPFAREARDDPAFATTPVTVGHRASRHCHHGEPSATKRIVASRGGCVLGGREKLDDLPTSGKCDIWKQAVESRARRRGARSRRVARIHHVSLRRAASTHLRSLVSELRRARVPGKRDDVPDVLHPVTCCSRSNRGRTAVRLDPYLAPVRSTTSRTPSPAPPRCRSSTSRRSSRWDPPMSSPTAGTSTSIAATVFPSSFSRILNALTPLGSIANNHRGVLEHLLSERRSCSDWRSHPPTPPGTRTSCPP